MRSGKPSNTSSYVAFSRALATAGVTKVPGFSDPFAAGLLPEPWSGLYRVLARISRVRARSAHNLWWCTGGLIDEVPLRSLAIDEHWDIAYGRGIRQLVILGAGLDARAYRLESLADVTVFEVDHPSTQRLKQSKAARIPTRAATLTYVGVKFGEDDLELSLRDAGLDPRRPSFWIWEGVTMYLDPSVTADTLGIMSRLSAPQSLVAVTYLPPGIQGGKGMPWLARLAGLLGEPFQGAFTPGELRELFEQSGLEVVDESGLHEWVSRFSLHSPPLLDYFTERLMVGHRP